MEAQGVATRSTAAEIIRLHGASGPHMLHLSLLDSETVIFTYAIRDQGVTRFFAAESDSYQYETDSGYDADGSTQTFTGQTLATPLEPGSVDVPSSSGAPQLRDTQRDGILYAQDVAARKIGASGTWAALASESFVVSFDGNPNETVALGTEATIAAAVIAINAILLNGTAVARDANNIDLVGVTQGYGGTVQVVSADAGITTKIGIAVGSTDNNFGTINYFSGALEMVYKNGYTPSSGGTADAATLTGSVTAPFNLAPGDTLICDIDNLGDETATIDAAQSTHPGEGGTFAASSSEGMVIKLDGGENQSVALTAGGETTIATYVARLNAVMLGCHAVANMNSIGGCVGLVNEIKSDWNAHVADASSHTNADGTNVTAVADSTISGGVASCDTLFDDLKSKMNAHLIAASEEEEAITLCAELRVDYEAHRVALSHEEECAALVNDCRTQYIAHLASIVTLSEIYTALNDIHTEYEAHRVDTTYHSVSNTTDDTSGTPAATTFATAVTLADDIKAKYNNHRTDVNENSHPTDDDTNVVTGAGGSTTIAALVTITNDLLTQYQAHALDVGSVFHLTPDVVNVATADPAETAAVHMETDVTNTIGGAATTYAQSYTLAGDITTKYNFHRTDGNLPGPPPEIAGWHGTDDDTNTLTTAPDPATTPTELAATLTEMKTDLNAHFASAVFHVNADAAVITADLPGTSAIHSIDNTTDNIAAGAPASLANCYTVSDQMRTAYNNHRVDNTEASHPTNDTVNTVAPAGAPATLDDVILLLHDLKTKFNLHVANTGGSFHINADAVNVTTSPNVRTAAIHEIDDTTNTIGGTSDGTLGTLLTNLTELKTDYNAHRTQATIHHANDTTNVVTFTDDSIDLVSDKFGTDSVVRVVSADANFIEKTGIQTGTATAGTGDVADINAVTIAELKVVIEIDMQTAAPSDLVIASDDGTGKLKLTSVSTGASAELDVAASNIATVAGLSLTPVTGEASTTDPVNLLVNYIQGVSRSGPGRFVEKIPNIPEGSEFLVYGMGQSGSCRVKAAMQPMRY